MKKLPLKWDALVVEKSPAPDLWERSLDVYAETSIRNQSITIEVTDPLDADWFLIIRLHSTD